MSFKFERLEIWQLALDYIDLVYEILSKLPDTERYNLASQLRRASTSIALNIAEGSTGQTDAEQSRFLGMAQRSLIETVACIKLIERNKYVNQAELVELEKFAERLAIKIQAMRKSLTKRNSRTREDVSLYQNFFDDDSKPK